MPRSSCWTRPSSAFEKVARADEEPVRQRRGLQADVVQAETQLKTTQAQAIDVGVQRAQLEHAIALLIGKPRPTSRFPRRR